MLKVSNLDVSYGKHQALNKLSLQVDKGELVVILGANGAGKSSLLRAVAGLCEGQMSGAVTLAGEDITHKTPDEIVSRGVALVPEGRAIFGDLIVSENLKLGAYTKRAQLEMPKNLALVYELFPKLRERAKQVARTMSGGEQQMVAIGRALMSAPDFLMLDEPSLGLSPLLSKDLFQVLAKIRDAGLGVLVVEQNAKLSLSVADRGYLIEVGSLVGEDSAQNLSNDPAVQAAYLGAGKKTTGKKTNVASFASKPAKDIGTAGQFIKPNGLDEKSSATPFSDERNLSELLQKADKMARERPRIAVPEQPVAADNQLQSADAPRSQTSPSQTLPLQTLPLQTLAVQSTKMTEQTASQPATLADLKASETRIEAMLKEFENAAVNARIGVADPAPIKQNSPDSDTRYAAEEPLPEIPVYRKSEIQIFKRNQHGVLEPAGKSNA